ncbi:MAG: Rrf2 family transcriptional regulator [Ignavibacteriales bacterium]|nr:Rrf2 family transcriptional regulator [Ignavibacteriales bacterium]
MSLIFSKSCEYALQASLFLAQQPKDEYLLLRDISESLNIPHHFLSKVLQTLSRSGVVVSLKGANGGFSLARSPKEIKLIEIVRAIDGDKFLDDCILGFPGCGDKNPCPVHAQWKRAKEIVLNILNEKTLAVLGKELDPKLDLIARLTV